MKQILAILLCVISLRAADLTTVIFSTEQVVGVPLTNTLVEFRPLGLLTWSNRIVPLIPFTNRTDSSGNFTTNFIPGSYRVTIYDRRADTPFTNSFPSSATPIYAADYITVGTNTVAGMAYNQATSLNLFAKRTNAIRILTNGVSAAVGYTNINFTSGVTGYLSGATLNLGVSASGSGDAGGTNARQWGSLILTNISGTGALTNAAAFQPASTTLSNIAGTGALTNATEFQPASEVLSNAVSTGVLTNPAVFQPAAAPLSNVAAAASVTLSNLAHSVTTLLVATNANAVSNILITPNSGAIVDLYATNHLSWTNFSGFTVGTYYRQTYRVTPMLINRTNLWPAPGTAYSGVLIGTNEASALWTTFTNGQTYYVTLNAFGTNVIVTCTRFSN